MHPRVRQKSDRADPCHVLLWPIQQFVRAVVDNGAIAVYAIDFHTHGIDARAHIPERDRGRPTARDGVGGLQEIWYFPLGSNRIASQGHSCGHFFIPASERVALTGWISRSGDRCAVVLGDGRDRDVIVAVCEGKRI